MGREDQGREGGREGVTNVGVGGEGVMKSRASYVGTTAQPCSTCEVTTPQWMCSPFHVSSPPPPSPGPGALASYFPREDYAEKLTL